MRLRLFADYFQLVLTDEASESSLESAWTDQALSDRIAVVGETCGVRTEVNVDVDVEVHVGAQPPAPETRSFDHVVEAGLEVPSGRLVVMGCTDYLPDAARTDVPAGWVRIRVQKHNLARAIEADIDSDESEETMERIRIDVWPAAYAPAQVLKQWVG